MARHPSTKADFGPAPARSRQLKSRFAATLRAGLPVIGVALVTILVTAIAYYIHAANQHGAMALGNDLVIAIEQRVVLEMHAYLEPPQQLLELVDAAVDGRPVFEAPREAERYARHTLASVVSVSSVSYADPDGNYLFVLRNDAGGFDTKLVDRRDGGHRVTWTRRNAKGEVVKIEEDPSDTFDPRTRPWYQSAESLKTPVWTDTYQFFTIHKPGITFSIPRYGSDGKLQTIMAVDIELASLCAFLKRLVIGASGKAYIIDRSGRIVAFPGDNWAAAESEGARAPLLDELGDLTLTQAYNRLRVEGYGRKTLELGDHRIIVSSEPVRMLTGRDWVVLIVVPESDFTGFVIDSDIVALVMSMVVVAIVMGLAALLTWRNVLAGRRVAAASTRQQALESRTRSFVELARDVAAHDEAASFAAASESAAVACAAMRVAIWRLTSEGRTLACEDCYNSSAKDHTAGLVLHRDELPNLFAALDKGAVIDTVDARHDRRTAELFAVYLAPLEINNVYIVPIVLNCRSIGMLSVEDPQRGDRAAGLTAFCDALAVLLALRFSAGASVPAGQPVASDAPDAEVPAATDVFAPRRAQLERTLIRHNASLDSLGAGAMARAAVGVVKLPDWTTVVQRPTDGGGRTAMDVIVHEARDAIEKSGVSYAALLDDQIVLAACSPDEVGAARDAALVAMTMLELRDRLIQLEEKWGTTLDFRLAMDVGTAMSSAVAGDPPSRNLWGGAVGVARILATTTARHTIASSETAYKLLSGQFLFRARGSYFLPETGNMRTFVLVGRT